MKSVLTPTPFQARVLSYRKHVNIANLGGRASGKTVTTMLAILDHVREYKSEARPLVVRESNNGTLEIILELIELFTAAFGRCTRNKNENVLTIPSLGAVITFTNIADVDSYSRHLGKTYSALYFEEFANYTTESLKLALKLRSNMRGPEGRFLPTMISGNPGGRSANWVYKNIVSKAAPWELFDLFGEQWIWTTSTLRDNPHISQDTYEKRLIASTAGDKVLADAWIHGEWKIQGGQMFEMFDPTQHLIPVPYNIHLREPRFVIASDWGASAPATALLGCELTSYYHRTDGRPPLSPGDVIILDECDTVEDLTDLSKGDGSSIEQWASKIAGMCERNGVGKNLELITDDAKGLAGDTVVKELRRCGFPNTRKPYKKDRAAGFALVRQRLQAVVENSNRPGLYITSRCKNLITTLPDAPRSPFRNEDVDPRWKEDHWLDALVYLLSNMDRIIKNPNQHTFGLF